MKKFLKFILMAVGVIALMSSCVPKEPITQDEIEILDLIKTDALDLISYVKQLKTENRPPTTQEIENIELLASQDLEAFREIMERVATNQGKKHFIYRLLKKILEARGVL